MIKSKIDARERALEMAVKCFDASSKFGASKVVGFANVFEQYLIGDAELHEVVDDNDNIKTLIGVIEAEMAAFRKQCNDNLDALTNFLDKRGMALSGTPCKSDVD